MAKQVLETDRLLLRELEATDLDFVAEMLGNVDVMHYWPQPLTRSEAHAWIQRQQQRYERDGHGYWLAVLKGRGTPVGQAGLLMCDIDGVTEPGIGYLLHRPFWGQGLAVEAARGCLDFAANVCGYGRVTCLVRPENVPSLRVACRLGLLPERLTTFAGYDHLVFATSGGAAGR